MSDASRGRAAPGDIGRRIARRWSSELLNGFWFLTSAVAAAGPLLAAVTLLIDKLAGHAGAFPGLIVSPDSARTILGSISGSLITIASLTSSLTIVTLQLLSNQYTPRTVRGFLSTRRSQVVLGTFIGIFLYCLVVLVSVREPGDENTPFVPSLGIVVSVVLAVIGLGVLVLFIHAMSQTIQVSTTAARICSSTATAIERVHGPSVEAAGEPACTDDPDSGHVGVPAGRTGYVRDVDVSTIRSAAPDVPIHISIAVGEFVTPASRIAILPAEHAEPAVTDAIRAAVGVERERDLPADPVFGVRQLVDIALRALSPGINDPSTAVTCLGYLRALIEDVAQRPMPAYRRGGPYLTLVQADFEAYLRPLVEVAAYAGADARVVAALLDALAAIAEISVDSERRRYVLGVHEQVRVAALAEARLPDERARLQSGPN